MVPSPDGAKIVFERDQNDGLDIYLMDADGSNLIRLTDENVEEFHANVEPESSLSSGYSRDYISNDKPSFLPVGKHVKFLSYGPESNVWLVVDIENLSVEELPKEYQIPFSTDFLKTVYTEINEYEVINYVTDNNGNHLEILRRSDEQRWSTHFVWTSDNKGIIVLKYFLDESFLTMTIFDFETGEETEPVKFEFGVSSSSMEPQPVCSIDTYEFIKNYKPMCPLCELE